ncbi:MAG: hypothetical protein ACOC22_02215 [bacterium]
MAKKTSNLIKSQDEKPSEIVKILEEFSKPLHRNIFSINLYKLIEESLLVEFQSSKWEKNPMKFCLDYYGQKDYYPIIMLVNNIGSIFEFDEENFHDGYIMAPGTRTIREILRLRLKN